MSPTKTVVLGMKRAKEESIHLETVFGGVEVVLGKAPTSGQVLSSAGLMNLSLWTQAQAGQGLGMKLVHSGINVSWEPSHIPEAQLLNSGR